MIFSPSVWLSEYPASRPFVPRPNFFILKLCFRPPHFKPLFGAIIKRFIYYINIFCCPTHCVSARERWDTVYIAKEHSKSYLLIRPQSSHDQPEKDGPTKGSSIPPTPVYSSRFLMVEVDISFATSVHWHSGLFGAGSLVDTRSTSKL